MKIFTTQNFVESPYATYEKMRGEQPVHPVAAGIWLLTRYEDAAAALLDKRLSNRPAPYALVHARNRDVFVAADVAQHLIAFRDAPDATQPRRVLATELQAFCRGRESSLDDLAADLVAPLRPGARIDAVRDIAVPYAVRAMCRLFGLPESDAARIKAWSASFFLMFHAIPDRDARLELNGTLSEFRAYIAEKVTEARRSPPQETLLSLLSRMETNALDEAALIDNLMLLVADSIENVWAGMASALVLLIENVDAVRAWLDGGGTWVGIVDECLRLESPGQYQGRIALEALEIGGVALPRNAVVLVGLAAANRDPSVFEDPDAFRPNRKGPKHLAFGLGRHACIGGALVRMETAALLSALWPFVPNLRHEQETLDWTARAGHRWLSSLPLRLDG